MWNDLRRSLRFRLAASFAAGSFCALVAITGFIYWGFQREINARNRLLLETQVLELGKLLERNPRDVSALEQRVRGEGNDASEPQADLRILSGGRLVVETPGMSDRLPASWFVGQEKTRRHRIRFAMAQRHVGPFVLQGALDISKDDHMLIDFRQRTTSALLLGTLLCAASGWWAAHRGLKPLRLITDSTRGITAERMDARFDPAQVPLELGDLVRALNEMLDRLDNAFSRLSQLSADLAHELRTPITNLMGEAEVALSRERTVEEYRTVLESSMEEFRRLSRLISRMLFLARAEDPHSVIARNPIDAQRLVSDVVDYFDASAEEQGVVLGSSASGTIRGDADMLRQALANLVSNALEATPRGGQIMIRLRPEGSQMVLVVEDSGRGIPPEEVPYLLDRFYRTQEAHQRRSRGTGLGLAIVQSIARLHGGDVQILSRPGQGTTVRMTLPLE